MPLHIALYFRHVCQAPAGEHAGDLAVPIKVIPADVLANSLIATELIHKRQTKAFCSYPCFVKPHSTIVGSLLMNARE